MNYYLVDYENVGVAGLAGVQNLSEQDYVIIFYSKNADKLTFDLHSRLCKSNAEIKLTPVAATGKNALDFQLSSYLGYLIATSKNDDLFYIISKDTGFEALRKFWGNQYKISLYADISKTRVMSPQEMLNDMKSVVRKSIGPTYSKEFVHMLSEKILTLKTKSGINNAIMSYLKDGEKTKEVCQAIKPLIKDKK